MVGVTKVREAFWMFWLLKIKLHDVMPTNLLYGISIMWHLGDGSGLVTAHNIPSHLDVCSLGFFQHCMAWKHWYHCFESCVWIGQRKKKGFWSVFTHTSPLCCCYIMNMKSAVFSKCCVIAQCDWSELNSRELLTTQTEVKSPSSFLCL